MEKDIQTKLKSYPWAKLLWWIMPILLGIFISIFCTVVWIAGALLTAYILTKAYEKEIQILEKDNQEAHNKGYQEGFFLGKNSN